MSRRKVQHVYIAGQINEDLYGKFLEVFESCKAERFKAVCIRLSTPGGETPTAMAIVDLIEKTNLHVHVHGVDLIASCGSLILLAAHERTMSPYASIFVHATTYEPDTMTVFEMRTILNMMEQEHQKMFTVWKQYSGINTLQRYEDLCCRRGGRYFSAEECLKWGIIDRIT